MISSIAHKVVSGYVREACDVLNYIMDHIRILYVPQLDKIANITQNSAITPDGCIVLNESWVNQNIEDETLEILRYEVYCKVRLLYKQELCSKSFNQYDIETIDDALSFSNALMTLKGLIIPIQLSEMANQLLKRTKRMLLEEFGLDSECYQIQKEHDKADPIWKFRLKFESELEYAESYYNRPRKSTIRSIDSSEKGSEENPFEDVNEAFEYIKELEKNAYDNDVFLKDLASQYYFYDINNHQFSVSWASPYVSFYNDDSIPSDGFIVNQNQPHQDGSFNYTLKPNLFGKKFLYRGQSQDFSGPCVPNLFRVPKECYLDDLIWAQELELLVRSHPLVKLLSEGIKLMHDNFSILMNSRGLTQHYYHKSSLLDLTSNAEVAKFFATTRYLSESDSYAPIHETDQLGVIFCYEIQMPNAFNPFDGYHLSVIGKQVFYRSGSQYGFLLDMPKGRDFKKMSQVKKFYFRHNPTISDTIFSSANKGSKYFMTDILEDAWKEIYQVRKKQRIISADAVKYNVGLNPGETYDDICKKLEQYDILVDDHHPRFSPELLEKYYKSIEEGWWDEFCSDIYFHAGDAALYKDCLLRIPQREEYKWAFENN